jgi:dienelactone hydrolase
MKLKKIISYTFVSFLLQATFVANGQPTIGDEGFKVIQELYRYDKNLPLNPVIAESIVFDTHTREKIYFTGVRERVGAYLAIPHNGDGPFPVILLVHGMGGSKEGWWKNGNWSNGLETTESLVEKGFAVFSIDASMHGERADSSGIFPKPPWLRKEKLMLTVSNMIVQTVQDYMRGVDYLENRKEIDINNIGAYGLSIGGAETIILTALDGRVKTAVTGLTVIYGSQYSAANAYNFTARINNQPILMLMGDTDGYYTAASATKLFESIGGNANELIIFKGGHKIPPTNIPIIVDWLSNKLR